MSELSGEKEIGGGIYNINLEITSGSSQLEYKTNDASSFTVIDESVKTAAEQYNITLPPGLVKHTVTGDGVILINRISIVANS